MVEMNKKQLYLLPGTMCDHRLWEPMAVELERIAPSQYQLNYLTIAQLNTIEDVLLDIKAQLNKSNKPVALIGFSLGGYLASAFALRFPELVTQLMLVANMSGKLPETELKQRKRTINWLKLHGYSGIPLKRIHVLLSERAKSNSEIIDVIKCMDKDLGRDTLISQLNVTTQRDDLLPAIAASSTNSLFCLGSEDPLVNIDRVSKYCYLSDSSDISIIKNTGHMLPLESPRELAGIIHNYYSYG